MCYGLGDPDLVADDFLNASITERIDVNDDLAIYRVKPDGGPAPPFVPGQFITLGLPKQNPRDGQGDPTATRPKMYKRAYSIASSANELDTMEFLIVLVDEGHLTPKIWKLHEGDRLWMNDRANGGFTLDGVPGDKDLVMVGTGTGLAPFVSMVRTFHGRPRWRRLVLVHGVRLAGDLAYRQELEGLAEADPTVTYVPTVTREPEGSAWAGVRGRVQSVLEPAAFKDLAGFELTPDGAHVFLCGNPKMITSVEEMLEQRGFVTQTKNQPGNVHFERYW